MSARFLHISPSMKEKKLISSSFSRQPSMAIQMQVYMPNWKWSKSARWHQESRKVCTEPDSCTDAISQLLLKPFSLKFELIIVLICFDFKVMNLTALISYSHFTCLLLLHIDSSIFKANKSAFGYFGKARCRLTGHKLVGMLVGASSSLVHLGLVLSSLSSEITCPGGELLPKFRRQKVNFALEDLLDCQFTQEHRANHPEGRSDSRGEASNALVNLTP